METIEMLALLTWIGLWAMPTLLGEVKNPRLLKEVGDLAVIPKKSIS